MLALIFLVLDKTLKMLVSSVFAASFFISPFKLKHNYELGIIIISLELLRDDYNNFLIFKLR